MSSDRTNPAPSLNGEEARSEESAEPKARKACINCRRQKMKCRIDNGNTCRRCHRSGVPCIFVPRANAAGLPVSLSLLDPSQAEINKAVLRRLKMLEDYLGLSAAAADDYPDLDHAMASAGPDDDELGSPGDCPLSALWSAAAALEKISPRTVDAVVWRKGTVRQLWSQFHDTMPGLHFLPSKQTFSAPRPVLLASILYCSCARGAPDLADLAPYYFTVLCHAIAQLSIPGSEIGRPPGEPEAAEEWAFQTVLGIILGGLMTEGNVRETGLWIAIAYRLILEHCPPHVDERSRDWRRLFSGVQIVDLEHASLHLSCPVIPIEAPLPVLQTSPRDQLYRLSRMMHTGLAHFTGRGLPTIWSCFGRTPPGSADDAMLAGNGSHNGAAAAACPPFSAVDAAVIRDWARQLDEWLVDFSSGTFESDQDRTLVFRQYVLHRLVVLSIYHPARGCNLYSHAITPNEQFELLLSARATLRLHLNDKSIWSNWDLVMITWAALIVLQGVEGGAGEVDDLKNIRVHLDMLRQTHEPKPSLRDKLVSRLEQSLEAAHTPSPTALRDPLAMPPPSPQALDYSWQIFDQASLQQVAYPAWPMGPPAHMTPMPQ